MAQGQVTQQQIYQSWIANGATPQVAQTMSAIAMAESSGFTGATNPFQGHTYMGLYQIGEFWGVDPSRIRSDDLNYQTQQAMKVLNQQGLKAWETYTTGAYQQYLTPANSPPLSGQAALNELMQKQAAGVPLDSFESLALGGGLTKNKYAPFDPLATTTPKPSTDQGPNAADAPGGLTILGGANPAGPPTGGEGGGVADAPAGINQNAFINS